MGIAAGPEFVADGGTSIHQKISAFIAAAGAAAADGLTWQEFGELLVSLMKLCVSVLDATPTIDGAEKKAAVLDAVGMLFDAVAGKCIPPVAYPLWAITRPAVRSLLLALSAGAIEQLLPLVRASK